MADKFEIRESKKHTLFNPAFIDDYGFTPEEFRVFARIMRRSLGGQKGCFESVPEMSKTMHISERLIKRAFKVLVACNAVTRTERKGKTDLFDFNNCDKWKPSADLPAIRTQIDSEIKKTDRQRKSEKALVGAETHPVSGCGNASSVGAETTPLVGAETHPEGTEAYASYPIEGNPMKGEARNAPAPEPARAGIEARRSEPVALPASSIPQPECFAAMSEAEEIYRDIFGGVFLRGDQVRLLENIPALNRDVWRRTCELWRGDGWRATSIASLIDRYEKELAKVPKMKNGFIEHDTKPKSKFLH